jgi:hypothetical protein
MCSTDSYNFCMGGSPVCAIIAFPLVFYEKQNCIVFLLSQVTKRVCSRTSPLLHDVEKASDNPNG